MLLLGINNQLLFSLFLHIPAVLITLYHVQYTYIFHIILRYVCFLLVFLCLHSILTRKSMVRSKTTELGEWRSERNVWWMKAIRHWYCSKHRSSAFKNAWNTSRSRAYSLLGQCVRTRHPQRFYHLLNTYWQSTVC